MIFSRSEAIYRCVLDLEWSSNKEQLNQYPVIDKIIKGRGEILRKACFK